MVGCFYLSLGNEYVFWDVAVEDAGKVKMTTPVLTALQRLASGNLNGYDYFLTTL